MSLHSGLVRCAASVALVAAALAGATFAPGAPRTAATIAPGAPRTAATIAPGVPRTAATIAPGAPRTAATIAPGVPRGAGAAALAGHSSRGLGTAACPPAPRGYSSCLVHVLRLPVALQALPGSGIDPGAGPAGYSPNEIATTYGYSTTGGEGSTIAVVDAYSDSTISTDLAAFSTQFGLRQCTASNHCLSIVNQAGGTSTAPAPPGTTGWALETSLDVEWVHALAPNADILLVEAATNRDTDLFAATRYAATKAQYVTMPWGGTEFSGESALNAAFANSSVSYFAAVGDTASELSYPATSPDVVAVGGTTLTVTSATGAWKSETAWDTAGGGCSRYETASAAQARYPSYDQKGANCAGKRAVPDLSLDANPSSGVAVYDTVGYPGWIVAGGTSAATDMVAAHAAETGAHVDATFVYGGTINVYNVSAGSNGHPCEIGYNLCTGLGSWNTAVGSTSAGAGSSVAGAFGFTSGTQELAAGTWSGALTVALSKPATGAAGVTVTVASSSSTGELSTSPGGILPSRSLTLRVPSGSLEVPTFYYRSTTAGTRTITVSAPGWAPAVQTVTVTASPTLEVVVAPGPSSRSKRSYHVPLTVTVTSSDRRVARAHVSIAVYLGTCAGRVASGAGTTGRVASGAGSTGSRGLVVFTFAVSATGTYCAKVTAAAPDATPGSSTAPFTISAALPPVTGGARSRSRVLVLAA